MDSLTLSTAKIASGAIVCCECELQGDITIGSRTVIHPRAKIIALSGPIVIGENNIIEEQVQIINSGDEIMTIGNNNVFEVDCRVESKRIGDNNIVESKAFVGKETSLSNGCVIGAKCEVLVPETLQEGSLFYGSGPDVKRRVQADKPSAQGAQIEFLSKVLPNYHRIRKPLV
uniref:Dynactin subunit 6 n=1 Tax=Ceriodaphnia reticulata TaxID=302197 RepID=A0A4Y7LY49_9CRUS|nr:EOG090X0I48 [Ceriodaphnia reticulata]SVE73296.1 EOG090X0I48 [Ceriodaphnia reticulata]